ncbi:glutathione transferase GstA [Pelagibius sp. Alg239-R121]|uniref:glutathione transferase GstA n=1 Tax=Pelagibius sp. Alg239-R121 TaxID=2993448 RepID=UPI0024A776DA|nr:glutathione transferase GstA [Pelagibius sp. Alg239-R121]
MKLYYKPGACSLSPHIVLREAGIDFEIEQVDTTTKKTASGADFTQINPKGYVPALVLDNGQVLTEGAAIVQYIADQNAPSGLAPAAGTIERARLQEHLNYVASEFHKAFGPLFTPDASETEQRAAKANIVRRLDYLESLFADGRAYLLGDSFSVADAYLFVVTSWARFKEIDLSGHPQVSAFLMRVAGRTKVQEALQAEGLA